ncbi:alpha/beta hydrolase [Litorimonas haliclonae]|uniref:alpha/beta hydrolase n=1 Tax=Litorimonas haliclonae TaxID=2081977 RepID=UPI0039EF97BF
MKIFAAALGCAICLSFSAGSSEAEDVSTFVGAAQDIVLGQSFEFESSVLGESRRVSVRLPDRYVSEPDKTFPVLYLIDGGPQQDFPHIAGILQSTDINWTIEPMILVGIETRNRQAELTPPATDPSYEQVFEKNGGAESFRQFIETEIMPWVEDTYRTDQRDIVMGESLAGLFVMETFAKRPDLFSHFISVSPSLWWDNLSAAKSYGDDFLTSDETTSKLYVTMGNEGALMQAGLDVVLEGLSQSNKKWTYVDRRNSEDHASIYHPAALDALRSFFSTPYRAGVSSDSVWMFEGGAVPPLSDKARESVKEDCTLETAEKISFETYNRNPVMWRGVCVVMKPGDSSTRQSR